MAARPRLTFARMSSAVAVKTNSSMHSTTAWSGGSRYGPRHRFYSRRTGAERGFAATKDPASNGTSRDRCRLMGLAALMLSAATLIIVRSQRIPQAWNTVRKKPSTGQPLGYHPKTRNGAARPSPAPPPGRPDPQPPRPPAPAPVSPARTASTTRESTP